MIAGLEVEAASRGAPQRRGGKCWLVDGAGGQPLSQASAVELLLQPRPPSVVLAQVGDEVLTAAACGVPAASLRIQARRRAASR